VESKPTPQQTTFVPNFKRTSIRIARIPISAASVIKAAALKEAALKEAASKAPVFEVVDSEEELFRSLNNSEKLKSITADVAKHKANFNPLIGVLTRHSAASLLTPNSLNREIFGTSSASDGFLSPLQERDKIIAESLKPDLWLDGSDTAVKSTQKLGAPGPTPDFAPGPTSDVSKAAAPATVSTKSVIPTFMSVSAAEFGRFVRPHVPKASAPASSESDAVFMKSVVPTFMSVTAAEFGRFVRPHVSNASAPASSESDAHPQKSVVPTSMSVSVADLSRFVRPDVPKSPTPASVSVSLADSVRLVTPDVEEATVNPSVSTCPTTPPENYLSARFRQIDKHLGNQRPVLSKAVLIYVDGPIMMPLPMYILIYLLSDASNTSLHGLLDPNTTRLHDRHIYMSQRPVIYDEAAKLVCERQNLLPPGIAFIEKYFLGDLNRPILLRVPTLATPKEVKEWTEVVDHTVGRFSACLGESSIVKERFQMEAMPEKLRLLLQPNVLDRGCNLKFQSK